MTKKRFAEDGDVLWDGFKKDLPKAFQKASKEHQKSKGKPAEFDREEMIEGHGGFQEPDDDGIR